MRTARRHFLAAATAAGFAGLTGAAAAVGAQPTEKAAHQDEGKKPQKPAAADAEDISATEDLMREHGVLRRILLVYEEGLRRLDRREHVTADVFQQCAGMVRKFVEDYHEKLEEDFIFPLFEKRHELGPLIDTLRKQHRAGRSLTDVIAHNVTAEQFPRPDSQKELAQACRAFLRLYRPHAAREDTVLFPALHKIVTEAQMDKLGDQFEDEENRLFGKDGFEHMVGRVAAIEKTLGIFELDQFTPKA